MPITDAALNDLRLRYEAAYDAHGKCQEVIAELERRRERPSPQQLADEAAALRELTDARRRYRDALIEVAFLSDDTPR